MKRNRFHQEEDQKLLQLVGIHGKDWKAIAAEMDMRTARQCKDRYLNFLSPEVSKTAWTDEEDNILRQKVIQMGQKWSQIKKFFPNRSDTSIKNRWLLINRKNQQNVMTAMQVNPFFSFSAKQKEKLPVDLMWFSPLLQQAVVIPEEKQSQRKAIFEEGELDSTVPTIDHYDSSCCNQY